MKKTYLGAVCKGDISFGIVFPDFPGCVSSADTVAAVILSGQEALQGHIEALLDGGDLIASPRQYELEDVLVWLDEENDPSGDDWLGLYPVTVDVVGHPGTVAVPVEADIVHAISKAMEDSLSTLSPRQFIEQATRRELARLKKSA